MSIAALQANAFYEQVVNEGNVFTFTSDDEFLVFQVHGQDVVPFWSSRSRVQEVVAQHPKYGKYQVNESSLSVFLERTLPHLEEENIHVGVNWSVARLVGYDVSPQDVARNLNSRVGR